MTLLGGNCWRSAPRGSTRSPSAGPTRSSSFVLTAALVLLLAAGLLGLSQPGSRLVVLNWSALAATGLWLLCAPIPHGTYARLTLGLQLWVSENVAPRAPPARHRRSPARQHHRAGATAASASQEACSGVRSADFVRLRGPAFLSACSCGGPGRARWLDRR
jgi:hypothetical protein